MGEVELISIGAILLAFVGGVLVTFLWIVCGCEIRIEHHE